MKRFCNWLYDMQDVILIIIIGLGFIIPLALIGLNS